MPTHPGGQLRCWCSGLLRDLHPCLLRCRSPRSPGSREERTGQHNSTRKCFGHARWLSSAMERNHRKARTTLHSSKKHVHLRTLRTSFPCCGAVWLPSQEPSTLKPPVIPFPSSFGVSIELYKITFRSELCLSVSDRTPPPPPQ